jgi:hypothetical protein
MAEDQRASKYIYITWTQGIHWKKIKISEEDVLITNIVMEKSNTGLKFLVYGKFFEFNWERYLEPARVLWVHGPIGFREADAKELCALGKF